MKTLLVAATHAELSGVFRHFNLPEKTFTSTNTFDILITGVGMTATAFALGRFLNKSYGLVLNLGIAGSFNPDIPLGSLVNVVQDQFAELGAEDQEEFIDIEQLGFGRHTFHARYEPGSAQIDSLRKVKGITVNRVHGRLASISEIKSRLSPDVESMEGSAVFYCCNEMSMPVLQVRSISNYVEPRNKENWQIGPAIKNLNEWAIDFLTKA
jgi:futalosine hydrolase